ncbi:hypothetical protein RIF29_24547 [Crotalaria pallida]|uniref:RRM domain-containing protein n=1 Tax=Crotalaria pallida TaxID=3830 RepID=A0AAN9HZ07_CROPI
MVVVGPCSGGGFKPQGRGSHNIAVWRRRPILTSMAEARLYFYSKGATQDRLQELFEHYGKITKVVIPPTKARHETSRFGFVHFAERSSAMKALKNTEKYEMNEFVSCLDHAVNLFCDIGRLSMAARYVKLFLL